MRSSAALLISVVMASCTDAPMAARGTTPHTSTVGTTTSSKPLVAPLPTGAANEPKPSAKPILPPTPDEAESPFSVVARGRDWFRFHRFDNRTVVQSGRRFFDLQAQTFTPLAAPFAAGLDLQGGSIVQVGGSFPEEAWLVFDRTEPCAQQDVTELYRWAGTRWAPSPPLAVNGIEPVERYADICTWGSHHLALVVSSSGSSIAGSRFAALDDPSASAPVFTEAAPAQGEQACKTQLVASTCVTLPAGALIVVGRLCAGMAPALEHFAPGSSRGTLHLIPRPAGARSLSVTAVAAVHSGVLYLAGGSSAPARGYLAAFSASDAEVRIVPSPDDLGYVTSAIASSDDSVWFAPQPPERETPDHVELPPAPVHLWRRTADGRWHPVMYPLTLEPEAHAWTMGEMGELVAAAGEAWFVAHYTRAARGSKQVGTTVLYRTGPAPQVWLVPGGQDGAEPGLPVPARNPCLR
ncbi:MAG: hypothetical protein ABI548_09975 [Polyangiaceae bacterium]